MPFTEADALDALREAMQQTAQRPEGAYTVRELCQVSGAGDRAVRDALTRLIAQGKVEAVKISLTYLDGRVCPTSAYRFVSPPKGRKKAA